MVAWLHVHIPFNFERTLFAVFLMSAVRSSNSCLVSERRHQNKLGASQQAFNAELKEAKSKSFIMSLTTSPTGSEKCHSLFVFGDIWFVCLCLPLVNHSRRRGQTDSAHTWSTALTSGGGTKGKGRSHAAGEGQVGRSRTQERKKEVIMRQQKTETCMCECLWTSNIVT